jgi:hypothetical protein
MAPFRYLLVNFDAEDLEKYRPGGFHPVHLEDIYADKRFKVVRSAPVGFLRSGWRVMN